MPDRDLGRLLRELGNDGRTWVEVGVVSAIEEHDQLGYVLTVTLPDGREVEARLVALSCGGDGAGVWVPVVAGAEVVLWYPAGDRNRALALPGPTSSPAKPPSGWANNRIEVVHAGGLEVRAAEGATVKAVVIEDLLADLASALTEIQAGLAAIPYPTHPYLDALILALPTGYRAAALRTE